MSKPPHNQRGQRPAQQPSTQQTPKPTVVATASGWSGPLPPPEALERFNTIIPRGADRILAMAEAEQAHRIATESEGSRATIAEARRGQFVGAAVSIIALGGAVFTAYIGAHWEVSVAFLSLPILGIVRVLVRPRRER